MRLLFILLLLPALPENTLAQTCCTGGAPLTGSLNIGSLEKNNVGISLTYDNNQIDDFMLVDEVVDENVIQRYTNSLLTQVDFGLSDRLTATVLIPYLVMGQVTEAYTGSIEWRTHGIGDILLLAQYGIELPNQATLAFSGGFTLPTGATKNKSKDGLVLPANLQPGTGSVDFITSAQYQTSFPFRRSLSFAQTAALRLNTVSHMFTFHDSYRFGHVFQSFTTLSDQFVLLKLLQTPSITFRYRYAGQDMNNGGANPNTGGQWLTFAPGWAVNITDNILLGFTGEWPLYRKLNGLQITTTRRLVFTLQFLIQNTSTDGYIH